MVIGRFKRHGRKDNMNKTVRIISTILTLGCFAQPAFSWNDFGHMVVASVAYRNLDPQTQARVNSLLLLNPYYTTHWAALIPPGTSSDDRNRMIFMLAATWPDAIKGDPSYHNDGEEGGNRPNGPEATRNTGYDDFNRHKYWHFIDVPFSQDGSDVSTVVIPAPNAKTQIAAFREVLHSTSASEQLKSCDLVWLLHMIGDVHQPLHCVTRISKDHPQGDAGGNTEILCGVSDVPCTGKLHAFWDNILGSSESVSAADEYAARLDVPTVSPSDVSDVETWIRAGSALARSNVYVDPVRNGDGPDRATAAYTDAARELARRQVALAGARLAEVLKEALVTAQRKAGSTAN